MGSFGGGSQGSQKENQQKDDKATANEIWKEPPEIDFPWVLIEKLDLAELSVDLKEKAERLKLRI